MIEYGVDVTNTEKSNIKKKHETRIYWSATACESNSEPLPET